MSSQRSSDQTVQPGQPDQTGRRVPLSRRHALGGAVGIGLGLPLLAACAGGDQTATDTTGAAGSTSSSSGGSTDPGSAGGSSPLITTADVPVGGGVILADAGVVVTQPSEGEFKGFSVTCTHQGCPVDQVSSSGISCPCHGSVFDITSGAPTQGPATAPLASIALTVQGDEISRA